MKRVIKFRGYSPVTKGWVYGHLIPQSKYGQIIDHIAPFVKNGSIEGVPVEADTIGQFTGMVDKNGKPVYEGDIVRYRTTDERHTKNPRYTNLVINYNESSARFQAGDIYHQYLNSTKLEIIGNVHDNPELLEEQNRYKVVNHEKVYFVK